MSSAAQSPDQELRAARGRTPLWAFAIAIVVAAGAIWGEFAPFVPSALGQGLAYAAALPCTLAGGWWAATRPREPTAPYPTIWVVAATAVCGFMGYHAMQSGITDWATLLVGRPGRQPVMISGWSPRAKGFCAHYEIEGRPLLSSHAMCAPEPQARAYPVGTRLLLAGKASWLGIHLASSGDPDHLLR